MKRLIVSFITIILVLAVGTHSSIAYTQYSDLSKSTGNADSCQAILSRAMDTLQETCGGLGRNNACYGNNRVKAEPVANTSLKFDTQGDIAKIKDIKTLSTSPLNMEDGTWGLSLLKLQANLPDTLPGQNVTFLVYGNTEVENVSGDMQAFYFTAGLGSPTCKEAPQDSIVIKSPSHTEITFTANGTQITIASTIVLRAERNKSMSVGLVEGHAKVSTALGSQELKPGEETTIPLGGDNGLTASGAPSEPTTFDETSFEPVLNTALGVSDEDAPINITIDGCIDEVQGNWITVNDYRINVGNDATLKSAQAGDCVSLEGTLKTNEGKGVEFILVKAQKIGKDKVQKGKDHGKGKPADKPGNMGGGKGK